MEEIAQLAHWLKGAAGTVGFDDFTKLAARLEQAAIDCSLHGVASAMAEVHELAARVESPAEELVTADAHPSR
jgi:HPt (histidine-containing phosphotransfer) domain-containing protein